jgi:GAF domain-containing protein
MNGGNEQLKATELPRGAAGWMALRSFSGPPNAFWPAFLAASGELTGASRGLLLRKTSDGKGEWRKLGEWSPPHRPESLSAVFTQEWLELAEECQAKGGSVRAMGRSAKGTTAPHGVAVRLQLPEPEAPCIGAFLLPEATPAQAEEALRRLALVADVPLSYAATRASEKAKADVEKFATVLDILAEFNAEKRFLAAALALCNAVATRFRCDRVSLGWVQGGYVRLQAISRTERFDKKMAAVSALEAVMEEALDQDEEILYPAPEGATFVWRDHEKFAQEQKVAFLASIPIRVEERGIAVMTCERQQAPFTPEELQQLRLIADQASRRLEDLKKSDRWWGARLAAATREKAAGLLGPEHTWAKLLGLTVAVLLLLLIFLRVPYRVEAKFILRAQEVAYLAAPFKGFIKEAPVRPGDVVTNRQPVLQLNTDDLLLEQAAAAAEIVRYQREAERARAAKALAEMRVAEAQLEQARARLDLVRYRLEQATLRAPFNGVVTEGDLRERIGAPVDQGETLIKIAETSQLYVEAEIPERDIHEIQPEATGQIAFISQPQLKYAIRLHRLEPAAVPKEGANVFLARCDIVEDKRPDWWRPGMSGICKINAGKRSLLWIATHRTVDFLRLWLWW